MTIGEQFEFLVILALPVASVAWTVTHEDLFREPREWCKNQSETCAKLYKRKFYYLFTCEYCFSHYVTVLLLVLTRFKMLFSDWRGYLVSGFALVWLANVYMNIYARLRLDIKRERVELAQHEQTMNNEEKPASKPFSA